jgi:hypothetical protein
MIHDDAKNPARGENFARGEDTKVKSVSSSVGVSSYAQSARRLRAFF